MKNKGLVFIICGIILLFSFKTMSAQEITGHVIDSKTRDVIPFVTIQFDEHQGVISNMEGYFNLSLNNLKPQQRLVISCMGYQTMEVSVKQLKSENYIVKMTEAVNELGTVYITNNRPNADKIMKLVNDHLSTNYQLSNVAYKLFTRETSYLQPKNILVEITKSTGFKKQELKATNEHFEALANTLINNKPTRQFTDVLSNLYVMDPENSKLNVIKATKLMDVKNNVSFDYIQDKATEIILKHLDQSKTYKVKTGLFKVEDSLSFNENNEKDAKKDDHKIDVPNKNERTLDVMKYYQFGEKTLLDFVIDPSIYEYSIDDVTTMDGSVVFIINFKPKKHRAKFEGQLVINESDYAVLRADYKYSEGKTGDKVNLKFLLGIKFVENVKSGTVIYKKNSNDTFYNPYYMNEVSGQYAYLHRPFKFIENGDDTNNKVAFDFMVEANIIEKYEALNLSSTLLDASMYSQISQEKSSEYQILNQYDPTIWKDLNAIEPLEEMKQFKIAD